MLGFSFGKIVILVAVIAAVWYGFKFLGRMQRIDEGERKTGERTMGERLRKSMRGKGSAADTEIVEDTEKCPVCGAYVSVEGISNCGKPGCPY